MIPHTITAKQVIEAVDDIHTLTSVIVALSADGKRALSRHIRHALWRDAELRSNMQVAVETVKKEGKEIDRWLEEREASLFAHHDALSKETDPAY